MCKTANAGRTGLRQLEDFVSRLRAHREKAGPTTAWIPSIWNQHGYDSILDRSPGEICVDPLLYTETVIDNATESPGQDLDATLDLDRAVIYSSLVRYTTAWDYDKSGTFQMGSFLRMIWLLPMLKRMGVTILYLLPVTRCSSLNMKGDLGSPYAIQDFFSLDPALHDRLLDPIPGIALDDELSILVAVCHSYGIRVVHDFIPRVAAMDATFIQDHPDWIYWIHRSALPGFAPPRVPELGPFEECTPENLATIYRSAATASHLAKFSAAPDALNPTLWAELKDASNGDVNALVTSVADRMNIVPAPAHSDWVNDVQPIWTDISFLRLFDDVHPASQELISAGQPPYVLFDTIKCNRFPAGKPNEGLWTMLLDAVHFQMQRYGFDGFRVDIGHTLPQQLLADLVKAMGEHRKHPIIISEDLFNRNHERARAAGYNIMLGSAWNVAANLTWEGLRRHIEESESLSIHAFACAETADTPRIITRPGGERLARMCGVVNGFIPHGVPFINTGLEVGESEPLNCGLGDNTGGADIKRAFFHRMRIDWTRPGPMFSLLCEVAGLRARFKDLLHAEHFHLLAVDRPVIAFAYRSSDPAGMLMVVLNMDHDLPAGLPDLLIGHRASTKVLLDSLGTIPPGSVLPGNLQSLQCLVLWQSDEIAGE